MASTAYSPAACEVASFDSIFFDPPTSCQMRANRDLLRMKRSEASTPSTLHSPARRPEAGPTNVSSPDLRPHPCSLQLNSSAHHQLDTDVRARHTSLPHTTSPRSHTFNSHAAPSWDTRSPRGSRPRHTATIHTHDSITGLSRPTQVTSGGPMRRVSSSLTFSPATVAPRPASAPHTPPPLLHFISSGGSGGGGGGGRRSLTSADGGGGGARSRDAARHDDEADAHATRDREIRPRRDSPHMWSMGRASSEASHVVDAVRQEQHDGAQKGGGSKGGGKSKSDSQAEIVASLGLLELVAAASAAASGGKGSQTNSPLIQAPNMHSTAAALATLNPFFRPNAQASCHKHAKRTDADTGDAHAHADARRQQSSREPHRRSRSKSPELSGHATNGNGGGSMQRPILPQPVQFVPSPATIVNMARAAAAVQAATQQQKLSQQQKLTQQQQQQQQQPQQHIIDLAAIIEKTRAAASAAGGGKAMAQERHAVLGGSRETSSCGHKRPRDRGVVDVHIEQRLAEARSGVEKVSAERKGLCEALAGLQEQGRQLVEQIKNMQESLRFKKDEERTAAKRVVALWAQRMLLQTGDDASHVLSQPKTSALERDASTNFSSAAAARHSMGLDVEGRDLATADAGRGVESWLKIAQNLEAVVKGQQDKRRRSHDASASPPTKKSRKGKSSRSTAVIDLRTPDAA